MLVAERRFVALPPQRSALDARKSRSCARTDGAAAEQCARSSTPLIAPRSWRCPSRSGRSRPRQFLVWDGDKPQYTCLLISGFAYRHKHGRKRRPPDRLDPHARRHRRFAEFAARHGRSQRPDADRRRGRDDPGRGDARTRVQPSERRHGDVVRDPGRRLDLPRMGAQHRPPRRAHPHRPPIVRARVADGRRPGLASTSTTNCRSPRSNWPMRSR